MPDASPQPQHACELGVRWFGDGTMPAAMQRQRD
jgi:hypothetical protein